MTPEEKAELARVYQQIREGLDAHARRRGLPVGVLLPA